MREACCTSAAGTTGSMYDGKSMWTLGGGIEKLPVGVCCLHLLNDGEDPLALTSPALLEMMTTEGRIKAYRNLCGMLFTFGIWGHPPDPEEALVEFGPAFEQEGIDLFLTREPDDGSRLFGRWLIFVDREKNTTNYTPRDYYASAKSKSIMKRLIAGGTAYELVEKRAAIDSEMDTCAQGKVCFTGHWKESHYEGDMDGYLKERRFSAVARTMLSFVNYTLGGVSQEITQEDDHLCIIVRNKKGYYSNDIWVDGETRKFCHPGGSMGNSSFHWVDDGMAILGKEYDDAGNLIGIVKRFLRHRETTEMAVELMNPGGKSAVLLLFVPTEPEDEALHGD